MSNLYLVVSEQLTTVVWEDWFNGVGHEEPYCIAELVTARSRSQATWLAWKHDKNSFTGDVRDKPRFRCECKRKNVVNFTGIVSDDFKNEYLWTFNRRKLR